MGHLPIVARIPLIRSFLLTFVLVSEEVLGHPEELQYVVIVISRVVDESVVDESVVDESEDD